MGINGTGRALANGALAGVVGVGVMTAAEKFEQMFTKRPNSYVPGRTLAHLLGLSHPDEDRWGRNHVMHWGTGVVLGALRGVMAAGGLRGPWASSMHTVVRLTTDQTLENATGVGSPPWTWPRRELAIDLAHKAIYGFAPGWAADRLAAATPGQRGAGQRRARLVDVASHRLGRG